MVDTQNFNLIDSIISFEEGELSYEETIEFFSILLKKGFIYSLQGSYQRNASQLIDSGILDRNGEIL